MLQRKAYHYFFTQTHTIKQLFPCKAALASCNLERQSPVILMRPDSLLRLWRYINHLLTYLLTYPRHPHRTGQKSTYPSFWSRQVKFPLSTHIALPTELKPNAVWSRSCTGWMPFLSANQECQSTDVKVIITSKIFKHKR